MGKSQRKGQLLGIGGVNLVYCEELTKLKEANERLKAELFMFQESETILGDELEKARAEIRRLKANDSWNEFPESMGR